MIAKDVPDLLAIDNGRRVKQYGMNTEFLCKPACHVLTVEL